MAGAPGRTRIDILLVNTADGVFKAAIADKDFWDSEVREKCILFLSQVKTIAELQDDETLELRPVNTQQPGGKRGRQWDDDTSPPPTVAMRRTSEGAARSCGVRLACARRDESRPE